MPRRWSFTLVATGGMAIEVDASWFILYPFLCWSLAASYFPANYPVFSAVLDWLLGVVGGLLLFALALLHESAHIAMARALRLPGCRVRLLLFGGATHGFQRRRPGAEALVALAGPPLSLALAALTFWGSLNAGPFNRPLEALLGYVTVVNVVLTAFNLVPGLPLDGGRLLQAMLSLVMRDSEHAARVATGMGLMVGVAISAVGIWWAVTESILTGAWLALMGVLIVRANSGERFEEVFLKPSAT